MAGNRQEILDCLLTYVRLSFNMRLRFSPGAAPANRREELCRTVGNKAVSDLGKPKKACNQCVWGLPYGRQRHSQRLDVPKRCKSRWNRHVACGSIAYLPQADSDGGLVLAMAVGPRERLAPSCYLLAKCRGQTFGGLLLVSR